MVERGGSILFVDLNDSAVREDGSLLNVTEAGGQYDLQGVAMTNPESTYLYLGAGSRAAIFEYEWHEERKITRRFDLPDFDDRSAPDGIQSVRSLAWVPTTASSHGGYFHVGSGTTGRVFVYELPLQEATGPEAHAQLISSWAPLEGSRRLGGLAFSGGFLFASYDRGDASHVLIYEAKADGLPGELSEQYEVDVAGAEGLAVRRAGAFSKEVLFIGGRQRAVFAYLFRFVTGFELHGVCAALGQEPSRSAAAGRHGGLGEPLASPLLLLRLGLAGLGRPLGRR